MSNCLSIYPHPLDEAYVQQVKDYILAGRKYGFNEVFTTLHLPELSFEKQLAAYEVIGKACLEQQLELIVDIGGAYIDRLIEDEEVIERIRKVPFSFIRFDYGFSLEQAAKLYDLYDMKGFVLNASTCSEADADKLISALYKISSNCELRACHNFYVRKQSGLSDLSAYKQSRIFASRGIPVYYCLPAYSHARGPLHEGLCTLEKHRYQPLELILSDLYLNQEARSFLFADEWLSEEELALVNRTLKVLSEPLKQIIEVRVHLHEQLSPEEKQIVLQSHEFRCDSPAAALRSLSSRQMAETGKLIKAGNITERKRGDITIDNELYRRYSGELQVMMEDLDADERVNVVGNIADKEDLIRLARFTEGVRYRFVEGK